ncbi:hypothetical protein [Tenacibaculum finnmarkense]|uniref:hypothetical protein n=1 Tax=Tenacibaculum finnmarkense TaxID=2781243 RepID=UPI001EFBF47A|nr:hypothetical protein [Tenacibaculum finnmarkense]MCG8734629.1 hypothetical protein [Tenacibaculum finnmarkense]
MSTLRDFTVLKMRAGQGFKNAGSIYTDTFENAKIEFANKCYNDLLSGVHGDNFIELSIIEDDVEEDGVYTEGELFMSKSDLEEGIDTFSEDVYTWKLVEENDEEL